MTRQAVLFLIVGLSGAGRTTRAGELEKARFSPNVGRRSTFETPESSRTGRQYR
jgi:hypothetical protein